MQLFILILVSLAILYALIRVLHARQLQRDREIADQGMPLPPLEEQDTDSAGTAGAGVTVSPAVSTDAGGQSWRDEVKSLRDSGRFREALALCSRQYPRMLAFRQTMITLRSQLKSGDEAPEEALKEIYRTAILAGLARVTQQNPGKDADLHDRLPHLDDPRNYWDELGYENLELLTKTDCNLLIRYWGEPGNHNDISRWLESR